MPPPCTNTRERLLADFECSTAEVHLRECGDCREWLARARRLSGALDGLHSLSAPTDLELAVRSELLAIEHDRHSGLESSTGHAESRIEQALRGLPRMQAPQILDDLVLEPSSQRESSTAHLLGDLSRLSAPPVLDRLLREELESPARHRTERFAGDLQRLSTPQQLDENPFRQLPSRESGRLRILAPLAAIAAGLILWANFDSGTTNSTPSQDLTDYDFDVVRVQSPEQLSPFARGLISSMTRGSRLIPSSDGGGSPR